MVSLQHKGYRGDYMEHIQCELSAEKFDEAVHNGLKEGGDLAFFIKPKATVNSKPGVCITFSVQLPDGSITRVQAVTTLANFENVFACLRGWKLGGSLQC